MTNVKKYDEFVMRNLRERRGLEPDDKSEDDEILQMSKRKTVEEYFAWEGIIGWGDAMIRVIKEVYGVNLKDGEG